MLFCICSIVYKHKMSVRFTNIAIGTNVGVLYYEVALKFCEIL
jgi:hypothetical protein